MLRNDWIRLAATLIGSIAVCGYGDAQPKTPDSGDWTRYTESGKLLWTKGTYKEAEGPLLAALAFAEKDTSKSERLAFSLNNLGSCIKTRADMSNRKFF